MAKNEFDQWIQIAIAVLVFGGTIFGAIAKKLIDYFSPKKTGDEHDDDPQPLENAAPAAIPEVTLAPPPLARPVAPPPTPQTAVRRAARPEAAPTREPATDHTAHSPPAAPLPSTHAPQTAPDRKRRRQTHQPAATRLGPGGQADRKTLESKLTSIEAKFDAGVARNLGQLDAPRKVALPSSLSVKPEDTPSDAKPTYGSTLGPLSPASLRQAIVLREILGPPVALRAENDLI